MGESWATRIGKRHTAPKITKSRLCSTTPGAENSSTISLAATCRPSPVWGSHCRGLGPRDPGSRTCWPTPPPSSSSMGDSEETVALPRLLLQRGNIRVARNGCLEEEEGTGRAGSEDFHDEKRPRSLSTSCPSRLGSSAPADSIGPGKYLTALHPRGRGVAHEHVSRCSLECSVGSHQRLKRNVLMRSSPTRRPTGRLQSDADDARQSHGPLDRISCDGCMQTCDSDLTLSAAARAGRTEL